MRFVQSSIFMVLAVAADHIPPTQRMIITSCMRPAYTSVTSWKTTISHTPFSLILFYFRCVDILASESQKKTKLTLQQSLYFISCQMCRWHNKKNKHPFNGPLSGTTWVSRYQNGKTNLDYTEARDSEWQ